MQAYQQLTLMLLVAKSRLNKSQTPILSIFQLKRQQGMHILRTHDLGHYSQHQLVNVGLQSFILLFFIIFYTPHMSIGPAFCSLCWINWPLIITAPAVIIPWGLPKTLRCLASRSQCQLGRRRARGATEKDKTGEHCKFIRFWTISSQAYIHVNLL